DPLSTAHCRIALHDALPILPCGDCSLCRRGITNLCPRAEILGFHRDGGFAEYVVVPVDLARNAGITSIPQGLGDVEATLAEPLRSEEHTSELQSREYLVCRL